tara:strand:- start:4007 stop:5317 length:1311 start_codon:yes stop_codon:yes gene_type:complete
MGFNLMAALGGAGRAMSQNIQEERLQMDKIELMDAEAATRERLERSREKREQDRENERIAEGLSYYLTDEEVAVAMKRGIGSAKELLAKAQNFDGDFGAAFNLPELKTAPYGEDLLGIETEKLNAIKSAEVARLTAPLSTFITEEPTPDKQHSTWAAWEIDWFEERSQIQSSKMSASAKEKALEEHDEIWSEYLLKIGAIADAKREPDKQVGKPDYTDAQLQSSFKFASEDAYSALTNIAGDRSLLTEERGGGNSFTTANIIGGINMYNLNIKDGAHISKQKKEWIEGKFAGDVENLRSNAISGVYVEYRTKVIELRDAIKEIKLDENLTQEKKNQRIAELQLTYGPKANKPAGVMTQAEFNRLNQAGELRVGGVYIVKGKDSANSPQIGVVTYLGKKIPYSSDVSSDGGKNFINHLETGLIDQDVYDLMTMQYLE